MTGQLKGRSLLVMFRYKFLAEIETKRWFVKTLPRTFCVSSCISKAESFNFKMFQIVAKQGAI